MSGWADQLFTEYMRRLPRELIVELAKGPLSEGRGCRVCEVLQWPGYARDGHGPGWEEHREANWLLNWHGISPVRCGAIYGAASLLASARMSRRVPAPSSFSEDDKERLRAIAGCLDQAVSENAIHPDYGIRDARFLRNLADSSSPDCKDGLEGEAAK